MYITQNLNEKLKVPVMWKLSTAFFPCSKDTFTRPLAPVLAAVSLLCETQHCPCAEGAFWGSREWSQGWSWPDQSWSPGWKGATPQAWEWGDTLGHAVELLPLLLSAGAVPLLWADPQQWGDWVSNELDALEGARGSLVLWHFLTKPGSSARPQLWPVTRATAASWA